MDLQKITNEYRMNQWIEIIRQRQESGQKVNKFCEERGLSRHAYFYWQRKLREVALKELPGLPGPPTDIPAGWVQLTNEVEIGERVTVEVKGCQIHVAMNTDPELLKKVCLILRAL